MAVDYFLKIEGIEGESKDSKHANTIELMSWNWGESQVGHHGAGGGGGAGKVDMQDFHFTMNSNKASVKLFLACAVGEHIKGATLICRKAGKEQQEFMTYKFTDLLISSFQIGGSSGDVIPAEQISFNFSKIEMEYKEQKADGTLSPALKAGWDLKKHTKV